jgi:hypothetical protein
VRQKDFVTFEEANLNVVSAAESISNRRLPRVSPTNEGHKEIFSMAKAQPRIALIIGMDGVRRITVGCDTDEEQAAAHRFLAAIARELRALSAAARRAAEQEVSQ